MSLKPPIAICALLGGSMLMTPAIAQYGPKLPKTIIPADITEVTNAVDGYCPPRQPWCALAPEWEPEPIISAPIRGWHIKYGGKDARRDPNRMRLHAGAGRRYGLRRDRGPKLRMTLSYRF